MPIAETSPLTRYLLQIAIPVLAAFAIPAAAQSNLITNGSFEAGVWDGTNSFVDSNNAWTQGGADFIAPDLAGYDYLRIFLAAPPSGATPSIGVLVDNVSLTAVPEPGSLLPGAMGLIGLLTVRKRQTHA